ncbi:MAG: hypothetical protein LRY38_01525 [Aeromonadaceae bacterium]|nr:hypothetical protein [Aeromonadaceae bacterium]
MGGLLGFGMADPLVNENAVNHHRRRGRDSGLRANAFALCLSCLLNSVFCVSLFRGRFFPCFGETFLPAFGETFPVLGKVCRPLRKDFIGADLATTGNDDPHVQQLILGRAYPGFWDLGKLSNLAVGDAIKRIVEPVGLADHSQGHLVLMLGQVSLYQSVKQLIGQPGIAIITIRHTLPLGRRMGFGDMQPPKLGPNYVTHGSPPCPATSANRLGTPGGFRPS